MERSLGVNSAFSISSTEAISLSLLFFDVNCFELVSTKLLVYQPPFDNILSNYQATDTALSSWKFANLEILYL